MFLYARRISAAVPGPACLVVVTALLLAEMSCPAAEFQPTHQLNGWSFDPEADCHVGETVPQGHSFLQISDNHEAPVTDRIKSIHRRISWKKNTSHCGRMYCDNPPYFLPNFGYYETNWRPAFVLCNEPGGRLIDQSEPFELPPLKIPTPAPSPDEYSPPANGPATAPDVVPGGHSTAQ